MPFCSTPHNQTTYTSFSKCSFTIPCPVETRALLSMLLCDLLNGYDAHRPEQAFCTALRNGTIDRTTTLVVGQYGCISLTYYNDGTHVKCGDPHCQCHEGIHVPAIELSIECPAPMQYIPFESSELSVEQQLTGIDCRVLERLADEIRYTSVIQYLPHAVLLSLQNHEEQSDVSHALHQLGELMHCTVTDLVKATYDSEKHECFQFAPQTETRRMSATSQYPTGEAVVTEAGYVNEPNVNGTRTLLLCVQQPMRSNPGLSLYGNYWYIKRNTQHPAVATQKE